MKRFLPAAFVSVVLVLGSLLGPIWAGGSQQALRLVPGPSPRQTINNFLATTEQAHNLIHGAIHEGLANPGWFYSPAQRHQVDEGQRLLDQATEALNLTELPEAFIVIIGFHGVSVKATL